MKRTLLLIAAIAVISYSGCAQQCGCNGHGAQGSSQGFGHHGSGPPAYNSPGPPTAAVSYPYYTVRGPRDYFLDDPPTIGR